MANWDVFHGDRLELERNLTTAAIRQALANGELRDDDLVRPAGTTVAWSRLADIPQLLEPVGTPSETKAAHVEPIGGQPLTPRSAPPTTGSDEIEISADDSGKMPAFLATSASPAAERFQLIDDSDDVTFPVINDVRVEPKRPSAEAAAPPAVPPGGWTWIEDDDEDVEEVDDDFGGAGELGKDDLEVLADKTDADVVDRRPVAEIRENPSSTSRLALPVVNESEWDASGEGALAEVPDEDEFSLSRSGPMTVEELDLAPMVDVAFQLVLFFMVAAQTVLYKTLEIPKPTAEQAPSAVAQGRSRTLDELKDDYILVEIDGEGGMKIDRQPVAADMATLVERLRSARELTHRKAMLLSAEYATAHRKSVLAYDAANEIGLGIVIARPASPQGPAPSLRPPATPAVGKPAAPTDSAPN